MPKPVYIVATIKSWNIKTYHKVIKHYPGQWHLITNPKDLNLEKLNALNPKYIFFPHWSHLVPEAIVQKFMCICFHETDLPYGRGGSPIQNLIAAGHRQTKISALKMVKELDAGPVCMKRPLSLEGLAEEIFIRASNIVAEMIKDIISKPVVFKPQKGKSVVFKRRKPEQSQIPLKCSSMQELYDHLRMLDAEGYPKAFLEHGKFRYEITQPTMKTDEVLAKIRITRIGEQA